MNVRVFQAFGPRMMYAIVARPIPRHTAGWRAESLHLHVLCRGSRPRLEHERYTLIDITRSSSGRRIYNPFFATLQQTRVVGVQVR
jgi:hypothetical protein